MQTKLDAINVMLGSVGQAAVASIDANNPEIDLALRVLEQVTTEVQAEGWHFNSEAGYPFMPDNDGFIIIPSNVLSIADNQQDNQSIYQTVVRQGKLYDKRGHSFVFPVGEAVSCDVVWLEDFEDLPGPFKAYITQRAARVFVGRTQGSDTMVRFNLQDELYLRNSCIEYDTQTAKTNMLQSYDNRNLYPSYRPFQVITR